MADCSWFAVEVLKQKLEKAKAASKKPPLDVEVEQCRIGISLPRRRGSPSSMRSAQQRWLHWPKPRTAFNVQRQNKQTSRASQPSSGVGFRNGFSESEIGSGGRRARSCASQSEQTSSNQCRSRGGCWWGLLHAHDTSSFRIERVVAILSRGVGRSSGSRERNPRVGVELTDVRWRVEDVRVDGEHGALRLPVDRKSCCVQWMNALYGLRGVRVGEATNPGPAKFLVRRRGLFGRLPRQERSRSSAEPIIFSSDDEPLLPGTDSRSTVPASVGALREARAEVSSAKTSGSRRTMRLHKQRWTVRPRSIQQLPSPIVARRTGSFLVVPSTGRSIAPAS